RSTVTISSAGRCLSIGRRHCGGWSPTTITPAHPEAAAHNIPAADLSETQLREIVSRVVQRTLGGGAPAAAPAAAATAPERGLVALGADHGGYALKETLKAYLTELGYPLVDCGTHSTEAV